MRSTTDMGNSNTRPHGMLRVSTSSKCRAVFTDHYASVLQICTSSTSAAELLAGGCPLGLLGHCDFWASSGSSVCLPPPTSNCKLSMAYNSPFVFLDCLLPACLDLLQQGLPARANAEECCCIGARSLQGSCIVCCNPYKLN